MGTPYALGDAENEVIALYHQLLQYWNERNAAGMAGLTHENVSFIGFDGSQMNSPEEIETSLADIFAQHQTAAYISIIRNVNFVTEEVVMLRAVVGMVPPGKNDINPAVNAIQTFIAVKEKLGWKIASFQNTPAAYHGRPQLSEELSNELREALKKK